jgi:hypothetical protein
VRPSVPFTSCAPSLPAVVLGCVLLGTIGCDAAKPDHDMYGDIVNRREYREISWNPANTAETHSYQPGEYRYFILQGSTQYEFKAWLPDGVVTDQFTGRLNEIKKDCRFNGVDIDWVWEIGGGFYACVAPADPGDESSARAAVTLTAIPGAPAPPPVVMVSAVEMQQLRQPADSMSHRALVRAIHARHRVALPAGYEER